MALKGDIKYQWMKWLAQDFCDYRTSNNHAFYRRFTG